jgi:hypothetical protein
LSTPKYRFFIAPPQASASFPARIRQSSHPAGGASCGIPQNGVSCAAFPGKGFAILKPAASGTRCRQRTQRQTLLLEGLRPILIGVQAKPRLAARLFHPHTGLRALCEISKPARRS